MPHLPHDAEPDAWHRYYAMESNNLAWALAVQERTAEQDQQMLNAAHASAWHWHVVGNELNRVRAAMLLAEVHAQLGLGRTALAYADVMREYLPAADTPDWEVAFTHAIHAHAAWAAGKTDAHRESYDRARSAIDAIADEEDRTIVARTFARVPAP